MERGYRVVFCGASNDLVHSGEIRAALPGDGPTSGAVDLIGRTPRAGVLNRRRQATEARHYSIVD